MDKKLAGLIGLFFLSFFVFITFLIFNKPLSRFTRASATVDPSAQQSIVVAWPLTLKPDSSQESKIDVFIRSQSNAPVPGRDVSLKTSSGASTPTHVTTDRTGKAEFHFIPSEKGIAEILVIVDNTLTLNQKVTIEVQ